MAILFDSVAPEVQIKSSASALSKLDSCPLATSTRLIALRPMIFIEEGLPKLFFFSRHAIIDSKTIGSIGIEAAPSR